MTDDTEIQENREYWEYEPSSQPPYLTPNYKSTVIRSPNKPQYKLPRTLTETTGPLFTQDDLVADEYDLSVNSKGDAAIGSLMVMDGFVTDEDGRPAANTLIELWQANSAGKYHHLMDTRDAPGDPNFIGAGRAVTDSEGLQFVRLWWRGRTWGRKAWPPWARFGKWLRSVRRREYCVRPLGHQTSRLRKRRRPGPPGRPCGGTV